MGGMGRSDCRRNGPRLGQCHLPERRRIQGMGGGAPAAPQAMKLRHFGLACAEALILPAAPQQVQTGPMHDSGQSITAAYEGWFRNPDGTFSLLFGYYNRNLKQELDLPPGSGNRIEPGGPDVGQPTHFLP